MSELRYRTHQEARKAESSGRICGLLSLQACISVEASDVVGYAPKTSMPNDPMYLLYVLGRYVWRFMYCRLGNPVSPFVIEPNFSFGGFVEPPTPKIPDAANSKGLPILVALSFPVEQRQSEAGINLFVGIKKKDPVIACQ